LFSYFFRQLTCDGFLPPLTSRSTWRLHDFYRAQRYKNSQSELRSVRCSCQPPPRLAADWLFSSGSGNILRMSLEALFLWLPVSCAAVGAEWQFEIWRNVIFQKRKSPSANGDVEEKINAELGITSGRGALVIWPRTSESPRVSFILSSLLSQGRSPEKKKKEKKRAYGCQDNGRAPQPVEEEGGGGLMAAHV